MRWRRFAPVVLSLAVVLACSGSDDGSGSVSTTTAEGDPAIAEEGEPAPDVTYLTFDGQRAALSDYRGRPVVVNFWASWCPPCITEMPAFETVKQDLGDEVAFLGIDVQETAEEGQRFLDETVDVTWDLGRDPEGTLVQRLGGVGMPTTVLIDADGVVQEIHTGELSEAELASLIDDKLLG
jgi:thiol-disulfide isomerase/thioredoxin